MRRGPIRLLRKYHYTPVFFHIASLYIQQCYIKIFNIFYYILNFTTKFPVFMDDCFVLKQQKVESVLIEWIKINPN